MATTEIKIGGFGGQGVILAGMIIGKAAALYDQKDATLTQAFGPEARGSACSAQVIVSDNAILYPYVTRPDIMVTLSEIVTCAEQALPRASGPKAWISVACLPS
jgi:2-oxoglutarate ferredoxin oxidoreductase subunit gamma